MKNVFFNLISFGFLLTSLFSITSKNPVISVIFLITTFVVAAIYLILLGVNFIGISYIVIYVGAIAVLFLFVIMMINIKLTDILETGSNYTKNLPLAIVILTLFITTLSSILVTSSQNLSNYAFQILPFSINPAAGQIFHLPQVGSYLFEESGKPFVTPFGAKDEVFNEISKINNTSPASQGRPLLRGAAGSEGLADTFFSNFEQIEVLGHNIYTYGAILLIILSIILLLAMLATIVISTKNRNI
jgi:NADH-ubiquinone oxidoreductase chain 6